MTSAPTQSSQTRDVVLIGSSAGGIEALSVVLRALPADLPAAVVVVQHQLPSGVGALVNILGAASSLPVAWADQGEPLEHGRVYVGPADLHIMFSDTHLHLSRGPRENFSRPSISRTFRSAAACFGPRAMGVLLTGMLDDGVSGCVAIHRAGGRVLVQDPDDAAFPELPRRAVATGVVDVTRPIREMGAAIASFVAERVEPRAPPADLVAEAQIDLRAASTEPADLSTLAAQSSIKCPECGGPTWEFGDATSRTLRCYLGHVHDARVLLDHSGAEVEQALWTAVRALHDRANTLATLGRDAHARAQEQAAREFDKRSNEALEQATLAREFLIKLASR